MTEELDNVLVADLVAGMGNQMFQAASVYALALRWNMRFACIRTGGVEHQQRAEPEVTRYLPMIADAAAVAHLPVKTQQAWGSNSTRALVEEGKPTSGGLVLSGHFQCVANFDANRAEVLRLFACPDATRQRLLELYPQAGCTNSVAIHVRRGDYLTRDATGNHMYHNLLDDWNYYMDALRALRRPPSVILVFSDDIAYCKTHAVFQEAARMAEVIFVDRTTSASDDLYLMSLCHRQIISNGTFAWWAAYLNQQPERQVMCPRKWIQHVLHAIVPENDPAWTVVPCVRKDVWRTHPLDWLIEGAVFCIDQLPVHGPAGRVMGSQ
jgi:hypothetical protein